MMRITHTVRKTLREWRWRLALVGIAAVAAVPLSALAGSTAQLSKLNSYAVLDESGLQASKIVTYVVLDSASSEPASAPVGR